MVKRRDTSAYDENDSPRSYRRMLGDVGFQVASTATSVTVRGARLGVWASFSLARGWCTLTGGALEEALQHLPLGGPRASHLVGTTKNHFRSMLDLTETATHASLNFSGLAVESCLKYLAGRRVVEEGTELAGMADSVLGFYELARQFLGEMRGLSMLEVVRALYAIACLQRVFGPLSVPCPVGDEGEYAEERARLSSEDDLMMEDEIIRFPSDMSTSRNSMCASERSGSEDSSPPAGLSTSGRESLSTSSMTDCSFTRSSSSCSSLPPNWQLEELYIMSKYSQACYGRFFLSMLHRRPQLLTMDEDELIAHFTGGQADWVQLRQEATNFRPAHFVSLDHFHRMVVVSVRGTMGVQDTLCDVTCVSSQFTIPGGGPDAVTGSVHSGFLRAAESLAEDLRPLVEKLLSRFPHYKLRLCGHSMGAGVAALLAALWINHFPSLHCYGFGAACASTLNLSIALAPHVTSVVLGNDFVPRLSLGTATDLRNAVYTLCVDAEPGLVDRITSQCLQVLRSRKNPSPDDTHVPPTKQSRPSTSSSSSSLPNQTLPPYTSHAQPMEFLLSVVKVLRANMQTEKLVPAGAVYHLNTVGAKIAPNMRRAQSQDLAGVWAQSPVSVSSPLLRQGKRSRFGRTQSMTSMPVQSSPVTPEKSCFRESRSQSVSPIDENQTIPCNPNSLGTEDWLPAQNEQEPALGEMRRVNAACFGELVLSRTMILTHSPRTYERAMGSYSGEGEWRPNFLHRFVLRMARET